MYIKRHLEEQILNASHYYPVVTVCGQRQVGKSTMLKHSKRKNIHEIYDAIFQVICLNFILRILIVTAFIWIISIPISSGISKT